MGRQSCERAPSSGTDYDWRRVSPRTRSPSMADPRGPTSDRNGMCAAVALLCRSTTAHTGSSHPQRIGTSGDRRLDECYVLARIGSESWRDGCNCRTLCTRRVLSPRPVGRAAPPEWRTNSTLAGGPHRKLAKLAAGQLKHGLDDRPMSATDLGTSPIADRAPRALSHSKVPHAVVD